jgi:hypothetical protein
VELLIVAHFAQDILKVGPGIWCFESRTGCCAFDADYLAYIPFTKNAGMKLLSAILGLDLHHCFGLSSIFGCPLPLYFLVF